MGSRIGTLKIAANKAGLTLEEYMRRRASGLKRCTACKQWKADYEFGSDVTRSDGLDAKCRGCRELGGWGGPSKRERIKQRSLGFGWCRDCRDWKQLTVMHAGQCRDHINAERRRYYRENEAFRNKMRELVHARKRGLDPMPEYAKRDFLMRDDGLCAYCDQPATTWDHVVAVSKGGLTEPCNMVPACTRCNSSKHDHNVWEWLKRTGREIKDMWIDQLTLWHCGLPPGRGPDPFE